MLKDLEGSAIQQAFKSSKFHWDGKTPLAKTLQTASFKNHGSDPNAGLGSASEVSAHASGQ